MESYRLDIYSIEDIDLIENVEDREEAQEQLEDEIEVIYHYLKNDSVEFDQISDTMFSIDTDKIDQIEEDINFILSQNDIAGATIENYKYA